MTALPPTPIFKALQTHNADSVAVLSAGASQSFTYGTLLNDVIEAKTRLLAKTGRTEDSIKDERIAFMVENSYDYVGAQDV